MASTEVLDAYLFTNLEQVQAITDQWLVDYNEYRPHEALGNIPPVQLVPRITRIPNLYRTMST
jgi:putative transposase